MFINCDFTLISNEEKNKETIDIQVFFVSGLN